MAQKTEIYCWIKAAGVGVLIPFILVSGPLAGAMTGMFLREKFGLPGFVMVLCVIFGFLASFMECFRAIKFLLTSLKK